MSDPDAEAVKTFVDETTAAMKQVMFGLFVLAVLPDWGREEVAKTWRTPPEGWEETRPFEVKIAAMAADLVSSPDFPKHPEST